MENWGLEFLGQCWLLVDVLCNFETSWDYFGQCCDYFGLFCDYCIILGIFGIILGLVLATVLVCIKGEGD